MDHPDKYASLIDSETWAFIRETEKWYPPDAVDLTTEQQRDVYDRLCRAFHAGYPDGVTATDSKIGAASHSIAIRRYQKAGTSPATEVLYLHGGGFVVGGLDSHDDICAEICSATGFPVTAVDYRLAPEHLFPADVDDVLAAFRHVGDGTDLPVVVCGDSAGGTLGAALGLATREELRRPAGQVLIYPALGSDYSVGSFIDHAHAPMLTTADMEYYKDLRTGGDAALAASPLCAPLHDTDFTGLPPTVVVSAECDPLCDDGRAYCDAIIKAGGRALFLEEAGLVHGYLRARHTVLRARNSFSRITRSITALGLGNWPPDLC